MSEKELSTFEKEMTWHSKEFDGTEFVNKPVDKTVRFKELDANDKDQHRLHFKIMELFVGNVKTETDEDEQKMSILPDSDKMYDFTVKAVKTLAIVDDNFTETDKKELLNDSIALLGFGMWFFWNKVTPFFQTLKLS